MQLKLNIIWSTIAVVDPTLAETFNDWTQRHVEQGFSWREGSVSFGTFTDIGVIQVEVSKQSKFQLNPQSQRAILVPFKVTANTIIVSDLVNDHKVEIPSGDYALLFEAYQAKEDEMWCRLTFIPTSEPVEPQILKADPLLSPQYPLLMEAVTA